MLVKNSVNFLKILTIDFCHKIQIFVATSPTFYKQMHTARRKICSSLKLLNESFWRLQVEFCVILWTVSHQVIHSRFWKLITVNTKKIGFSIKTLLNVYNFYVLHVHLGGLLFMKFNVTEKKTGWYKPLYLLIGTNLRIFTFMNFFYDVKTNLKLKKKMINWVIYIGGWRICIMLDIDFTQFFRKNILVS